MYTCGGTHHRRKQCPKAYYYVLDLHNLHEVSITNKMHIARPLPRL